MRSGTTWLYRNLAPHPEVWLPPVKELHYLTSIYRRRQRLPILLQSAAPRRRALGYLREQVERARRLRAPDRPGWAMRYFLQPPSPRWYGSLFPSGTRITGECTPAYAVASEDAIELLRGLSPDLKVIYLLRNPVFRDWSHAAWKLRSRPGRPLIIDSAADAQVLEALEFVERSGKSDYLLCLERWHRHFSQANVFVGFFDEIEQNPSQLLLRISSFLGIEASARCLTGPVEERVGKGGYGTIPDRYLDRLAHRHHDRIAELHAYFDSSYTRKWLDFAAERRRPSAVTIADISARKD